jgi:hypothetical protein
MSDLTTYVACNDECRPQRYNNSPFGCDSMMVHPDGRLQAIADAWQSLFDVQRTKIREQSEMITELLDALTQEEDVLND